MATSLETPSIQNTASSIATGSPQTSQVTSFSIPWLISLDLSSDDLGGLRGRLVVRVSVYVGCDRHAGVAELFRDDVQSNPARQRHLGVCVAAGVEPSVGDAGRLAVALLEEDCVDPVFWGSKPTLRLRP